MRPFGVSSMLAGFGKDGEPQIYQTDPAGTYSAWKANAIGGKSSQNMREFLEKNWQQDTTSDDAIKLTVKALLEVVDSGAKNMEIAIVRKGKPVETLTEDAMNAIVATLEAEAEEVSRGYTANLIICRNEPAGEAFLIPYTTALHCCHSGQECRGDQD
ncbi:unnamed protein product [Chrysoparadoxa australica]